MIRNLEDEDRNLFLNYNKKKYSDLLKYSQFLDYSCLLESYVMWEMKENYLELLDQFINKKITRSDFYDELFATLRLKSRDVFNFLESKLVLLSPHEKALGFADIIGELVDYCESVNDKLDSPIAIEPDYNLLKKEFFDSMEKFYFKIQQ